MSAVSAASVPGMRIPGRLRGFWTEFRRHFRNPHFWIVQAMLVAGTGVHVAADVSGIGSSEHYSSLFTAVLFGIFGLPVIYASLYFGRAGAIPTAIWAAVMTVPVMALWHDGTERVAEGVQHLLIIFIAVIVAGRVDREVAARRDAEASAAARLRSEARFRSLFAAAGEAILVFDRTGELREYNAAAAVLFGLSGGARTRIQLHEIFGQEQATALCKLAAGGTCTVSELRYVRHGGSDVWLAPVCSRLASNGEPALVQALFRDVTDQRERRRGLETFARQILAAQEEERRRIARDLHDGPLQSIVLLCRELDAITSRPASDRAALAQRVGAVRAEAEGIAAEVRRFSRDLRPSILDDLGLEPALRWLTKELEQRTGLRTHFSAPEHVPRLAPEIELGLFRIVQEALHNVERHAQAREAYVSLTVEPTRILLRVRDDGTGLDWQKAGKVGGRNDQFGLLGMRERVNLLNGAFDLITPPDGGTLVEVTIPVVN